MPTDEPPLTAEATIVAFLGLVLLIAGVTAGEWPAAVVGLVVAVAGLTVRALAVFKA